MTRALTVLSVALATVLMSRPATAQCDPSQWDDDPFERLEQLPVAEPVTDAQRVIVQLRATKTRTPADVYVFSSSAVDVATWSRLRQRVSNPYLHVAARCATRYRTDDTGLALVAMPEDGVCVAIAGEHVGWRERKGTDTWVGLDEWIRIKAEVVDREGRPAGGVPLMLRTDTLPMRAAIGRTDATGRLRTRVQKPREGMKLELHADVVGARVFAPVPDRDVGARPRLVQLMLPPTGALQVELPAALAALPFVVRASLDPIGDGAPTVIANEWTEQGPRFAFVALDQDFRLQLDLTSSIGMTVTGPIASGECVAVAPDCDRWSVLTGRLVDERGQPLATARWSVLAGAAGRVASVDDTGRFRMIVRRSEVIANGGLFELRCFDADRRTEVGTAYAKVEVNPFADEIGDVVLRGARVIARVRLVDEEDRPAAGVAVIVGTEGGANYRLTTDEQGLVEVRGAPSGRATLALADPLPMLRRWSLPRPVELEQGPTEQRVRVTATPAVTVSLAHPELLAFVTCRAMAADEDAWRHGWPDGDRLRIALDRDGAHRVEVRFGDRVIADVPALEVRPGVTDYAQVLGLELPDDARTTELVVRDADGAPVVAGVYLHGDDGFRGPRPLSLAGGRGVVAWCEGQRLLLRHREFRLVEVEPTGTETRVTMRPKARLRVRLPRGRALPESARVVASYEVDGERVVTRHEWTKAPLVLRPECDGELQVSIELDGARGAVTLHEQAVELPPHDELTDIVLTIDAATEELARELAEGK